MNAYVSLLATQYALKSYLVSGGVCGFGFAVAEQLVALGADGRGSGGN
jgi:hypothetical protein